LFEISDRIAVMQAGHLSEARPVGAVTREDIGLLMAGGAGPRHAH
jgi:simple sugar transport system ATP-binding protein